MKNSSFHLLLFRSVSLILFTSLQKNRSRRHANSSKDSLHWLTFRTRRCASGRKFAVYSSSWFFVLRLIHDVHQFIALRRRRLPYAFWRAHNFVRLFGPTIAASVMCYHRRRWASGRECNARRRVVHMFRAAAANMWNYCSEQNGVDGVTAAPATTPSRCRCSMRCYTLHMDNCMQQLETKRDQQPPAAHSICLS